MFLAGCMPAVFTAATGTAVSVAKDRSLGETIDDAKILALVKGALAKNNFRGLYTKINVEVVDSRVLYTGEVNEEDEIINAVKIAWDQPGVKEVINELKISKDSNHFNLVQYTKDAMITSQVKSKIFINREIKFVNYTIVTDKNVVYVFGIARSEEELEKVSNLAAEVRGVEKVVSHAKIKELHTNKHEADSGN
jgi:osmotically-inducible protein OsmY